jgi:hypothetical protein
MSEIPPESQATPMAPIPWEQPGQSAVSALLETAKLFLMSPTEAFRRMPVTADILRPLIYAILFGWFGLAIGQIWSLLGRMAMPTFFQEPPAFAAMGSPMMRTIFVIVLGPILIPIFLFIWAAIVHLVLMLLGGANSGFMATVRVLCYANTTQIFSAVPICGGFVSLIWGIILQILGIAIAHRTTNGKAALAVLLPLVLCCVCIGGALALGGAALFSALSQH